MTRLLKQVRDGAVGGDPDLEDAAKGQRCGVDFGGFSGRAFKECCVPVAFQTGC